MRRNMYGLAVFAGGRPLCTQILHGQGRPQSTILDTGKLDTLGYPTVMAASPVFPRFDTILECVGQTDGRMDRFAVALRSAVKMKPELRAQAAGGTDCPLLRTRAWLWILFNWGFRPSKKNSASALLRHRTFEVSQSAMELTAACRPRGVFSKAARLEGNKQLQHIISVHVV